MLSDHELLYVENPLYSQPREILGLIHTHTHTHMEPFYKDTSELNRTLQSVPNATFVYLTTPEMRTVHYSGHFNLTQQQF